MSNDPTPRSVVLEEVLRRAATDVAFRQRLLTHPESAVHEIHPGAIPTGLRLKFVERPTSVDALYVLPDPAENSPELTQQELEAVAGGTAEAECPWTCIDLVTCVYDTVSFDD